jgi:hypothetical protein
MEREPGGLAGMSIVEAPDTLDAASVERLCFPEVTRDRVRATNPAGPRPEPVLRNGPSRRARTG